MHDPHAEISRRLAARRGSVLRLDRRDAAVAWGRLAAFGTALALGWLAYGAHRLSAWWLVAPLVAFVALAVLHDRVLSARSRMRRAIAFHERALERLEGRFAGAGTPGDAFADPAHPYALDLDLFGRGSLFELLCAARTRPGEERLAAWLLAPAQPDELRARQRAVAALAPQLDLREDLAVLGDDVRASVDARALDAWGEERPLVEGWLLPASLALAGDIDAETGLALARRYFAEIPGGEKPGAVSVTAPSPPADDVSLVLEDRVELPRLYMAWHSPALFADGDAELDLVGEVLTSGKTSRLYRALVYEQRIATEVAASQNSRELGSFFQIVATAAPGRTLAEVERAISKELAALIAYIASDDARYMVGSIVSMDGGITA